MIFGFISAGYLIQDSYSDWLSSPISTTITTYPIDNLDFPTVTVCPPKGSLTPLNYDLMKADNNSLTEKDREDLKQEVYTTMVTSHDDFIRSMLATANQANLRQMYEGFQSTPKPDPEGGFKVRMWNNNGTFETPWYWGEYNKAYYKEDKQYRVILDLPKDIGQQVGSGSLVIQLEVDTREEEGWKEEVRIKGGPGEFKLYTHQWKTWAEAEAHCQSEGAHLASVLTERENNKVKALAGKYAVWLGGSNQEEEGPLRWSDGSPWGYTQWEEVPKKDQKMKCVYMLNGLWGLYEYILHLRNFVCRYDSILRGSTNLTLTYTKKQITGELHFIYSYQVSSQELQDSWLDKRMTGFKMSWRIENNPPMEMTTSEVGRSVQTPGFGGDSFDEAFYLSNQAYTSTLLLPSAEQIGKGSLVIQLEEDTRDEEGWQERVLYGSKFKLYRKGKTWEAAESYCQEEGGHLASVTTVAEHQEVWALAGHKLTWLGGNDQKVEGVWNWSDGSSWKYTLWANDYGSRGSSNNCLAMKKGEWRDWICAYMGFYVCQFEKKFNESLTLEYTKDNYTMSSLKVKYLHKAISKEQLDSLNNNRTTGFRVRWFLQDSNRNRQTETVPDLPTVWKPTFQIPQFQEQYLVQMVQLAKSAKANRMTREEILEITMKVKAKLINSGDFNYTNRCYGGQVNIENRLEIFQSIFQTDYKDKDNGNKWKVQLVKLYKEDIDSTTTNEDIETGYTLFSAVVYCSEQMQLSQFLHNLLLTQSPRTIIKATVNTIESEQIKERKTRKMLNSFYFALDKIYHLQLGRINLATASKSHLKSMIAKDWPYFTHYSKEIDQCFNNDSCQGMTNIIKQLGKLIIVGN